MGLQEFKFGISQKKIRSIYNIAYSRFVIFNYAFQIAEFQAKNSLKFFRKIVGKPDFHSLHLNTHERKNYLKPINLTI